jgi:acetyl esterase/lipase
MVPRLPLFTMLLAASLELPASACPESPKIVALPSAAVIDTEVDIAKTPVGRIATHVSKPNLTISYPRHGKRHTPVVLVIPGGAFRAVALGAEGDPAVVWLNEHGFAAALLKYRLPETPPSDAAGMDPASDPAFADAAAALNALRREANRGCIDAHRIGVIGFSAGAMLAARLAVPEQEGPHPKFVALIYGAPFGSPRVPAADGPPVFMAWAADDPIADGPAGRFAEALRDAGRSVDVKRYAEGGHGFGFKRQHKPTDRWPHDLLDWMKRQGFAR